MNHPQYSHYQETGLSSIKMIPAHWKMIRNGNLFQQRNQSGNLLDPILEVSIHTGVKVRDLANLARKQIMSDASKYKKAVIQDLAYNMMRMWQGAVGVVPVNGLVSPAYIVLSPFPHTDPTYYAYLFKTKEYMSEVHKYSRGIVPDRNRLYWESFKQLLSCNPPIEEQRMIVGYLKSKTIQINKLIQKKKCLIELLKKQKQAFIHRAVTRGLDPSVQLKSNCIEWFGNIPEHWEVRKLKSLTKFQNGFAFKPSDWKASGIPIIRIQNLNGSNIFNYVIEGKFNAPRIGENDLLFAWSGNRGTSFGSFLWSSTQPGYLNQHIFKLTDFDLDKLFFYFALRAVTGYVEQKANGIIGMVHITKPELGSIVIPIPPKNEQEAIGQYLKQKTKIINHNINNIERQIALIQEYRTRLISDVVTGQIDVRNIEIVDIVEEELIENILEEEQEEESLELIGAGDDD